MSNLDPELCYRALRARDARFDGRFFVAVTSTGIYCRPICPAATPRRDRCRFFTAAAAAQEAGFRPCLRCRPEVAPDSGTWRGTSSTVARGLALIAGGALDHDGDDGDGASVDDLAARLGVGARQLRRLFQAHLGASPLAVAQTRRVLFAKQLLHDTDLPMSEVALAAGFGSLRRFNETFRALFERPPSELRRRAAEAAGARDPAGARAAAAERGVVVRLRYRPPYDWAAMLGFLRDRAVDGVEAIVGDSYRRTFAFALGDGGVATGTVAVAHRADAACLEVGVRASDVRALPRVVARVREVFDLDADVAAIGAHLAADALLAPLVAARPGLRSPGAWDGFELAMRAVMGQQVSVAAARQLLGALARTCGAPLPGAAGDDGLALAFPTAAQVAAADLSALPMPGARKQTLATLARAALAEPRLFERAGTIDATIARLRAIHGVGDWTAHYIALRAAREPDAFPAGDAGLLRGAARAAPIGPGGFGDEPPTPATLRARAEAWRPWRAYAAQHLWAACGDDAPTPARPPARAPRPARPSRAPRPSRPSRAGGAGAAGASTRAIATRAARGGVA